MDPGKPGGSPTGFIEMRRFRRSNHLGGSRVYRGSSSGAQHRRTCGTSGNVGRSRSTLACCRPSWPSRIFLAEERTLPSRTFVPAVVQTVESTHLTLMTFAPSFPTRPDHTARSPFGVGLPLLGLSKDRPSIVFRRGVHSRRPSTSKPASMPPSEQGCHPPVRVPLTWFFTTSTASSSMR